MRLKVYTRPFGSVVRIKFHLAGVHLDLLPGSSQQGSLRLCGQDVQTT